MTCVAVFTTGCSGAGTPAGKPADSAGAAQAVDRGIHPEWSRNAVIYEVNIRQYTPEGTFAAFTKQLPRIRALGVDILWIMPVQPIGTVNRKGTLGSYYSIRDYTAVNPEFGTEADFTAMVAAAHAQGFKVILDWVANHTAFDHEWTVSHRDWYTLRKDGTISRAVDQEGKETDWSDVADLNYGSTAMRQAMIAEMKWWVDSTGIDGFRCDVAGFVPYDFWADARRALLAAKPDLFFLAEWEDPKLHASFDMTYGWGLLHLMNDVASGKQKTPALDRYFAEFEATFPAGAYRMYMTSNHDENSWQGTEFERMGANHQAAYVLGATVQRSMPLLYSGQEVSLNRRLAFFEKDSIDWTGPSLAEFYRAIFDLRHTQEVLWNGPWGAPQVQLATDGGDRTWAFTRTRGEKSVAVLVNFGDTTVSVKYTGLPVAGTYTDWFTKASVPLAAAGTIEIPAHGYRVLVK
ncbi:MAG: alpha amylase C-terminal domain-containing protein [Gemmatimonadaceae bacterium]|nr:alpha amylase C-terminal domain-containing protein [Gemmatimonadaceae bacterium]